MVRIKVKGVIIPDSIKWVYDAVGIQATAPMDVIDVLEKNEGRSITLEIASPGGDVWAGSEIFTALKKHNGIVTAEITSLAASIATVIMCGANKVFASPTAEIMIHNASSRMAGNRHDMQHMATVLETTDSIIANAYAYKTGRPIEEFHALMDKETWFSPERALEIGLIDGILFTDEDTKRKKAIARTNTLKALGQTENDKAASLENAKAKFRFLELTANEID